MKPEDLETKQFVVAIRGFVREEVRAYLRAVAGELRSRDAEIAELRRELQALKRRDRKALHELVGQEVTAILDAARAASGATSSSNGRSVKRSSAPAARTRKSGTTA